MSSFPFNGPSPDRFDINHHGRQMEKYPMPACDPFSSLRYYVLRISKYVIRMLRAYAIPNPSSRLVIILRYMLPEERTHLIQGYIVPVLAEVASVWKMKRPYGAVGKHGQTDHVETA